LNWDSALDTLSPNLRVFVQLGLSLDTPIASVSASLSSFSISSDTYKYPSTV
jgi:hypothetical protein